MPRLILMTAFLIAGFVLLISLGLWQLQRLDWKAGVLAQIESRIAADPVPLPTAPDPEDDKYLPVMLEGEWGASELHVLTSIADVGPGYRVIAPFVTTDGRRVMVERGFVRSTAKTKTRALGPARLVGNLHWPQEVDSYTPAADQAQNVWYARDVTPMAAALKTEPVLVVLRGSPEHPKDIRLMPVGVEGIANDHLQYAITWFSLAFVWAVMTIYFLWRQRAKS